MNARDAWTAYALQKACGDVERGELVVFCDTCGRVKGVTRPHGFVKERHVTENQKIEVSQQLAKFPRVRRLVRDALLALIRLRAKR